MLEALGVDFIDESEVLTPADEEHHIWKHDFQLALRVRRAQSRRGAAPHRRGRGDDPHQGRGGQRQHRRGGAPPARGERRDPRAHDAPRPRSCRRARRSSRRRSSWCATSPRTGGSRCRTSPRAASRRRRTPRCVMRSAPRPCSSARASSRAPIPRRARAPIVRATTHWDDPKQVLEACRGLGAAMDGIEMSTLAERERLANRGW